jgi:hypothetical protein
MNNNLFLTKRFIKNNNNNNNNWLIILTTALNVNYKNNYEDMNKRRNLYVQQILKWLTYTNFDIVVIESTGIGFPKINHPRLHKYVISLPIYESSSLSEAESLLYVLNEIKDEQYYLQSSHIIKVTGRYYLNNIVNTLKKSKNNCDLYLQIHKDDNIKWQHTEYYGIRKNLFVPFLLTLRRTKNLMENEFYIFIHKYRFNITTIGPFENNIERGGDGLIINPL